MNNPDSPITSAVEIVLPCSDLEDTLHFFVSKLGFLLESIFPADSPRTAVISKEKFRLRLNQTDERFDLSHISFSVPEILASELITPDGLRIVNVPAEKAPAISDPVQEFVFSDDDVENVQASGRAGMRYRDLIPGRLPDSAISMTINCSHRLAVICLDHPDSCSSRYRRNKNVK